MLWLLSSRGERKPADARDVWASCGRMETESGLMLLMLGLLWPSAKRRLVRKPLAASSRVALAVVVA